MISDFIKDMKIAGEVLAYCNLHDATEFHLDMNMTKEATCFTITASPTTITEAELEQLTMRLQAPRRREMEQDFWCLGGSGGSSDIISELHLIGMMVDDATITLENNNLVVKLRRLN